MVLVGGFWLACYCYLSFVLYAPLHIAVLGVRMLVLHGTYVIVIKIVE